MTDKDLPKKKGTSFPPILNVPPVNGDPAMIDIDDYYTFEGEEYFKVPDVRKSVAQHDTNLKQKLLEALPEKQKIPHIVRANECTEEGYNEAIDHFKQIIESVYGGSDDY